MENQYFVTPAPGHYGDVATVVSSHRTLAAARKAATAGYVAREGAKAKGDRWTRSMEQTYPEVR